MVALTACFDASGKELDQQFMVVAGFISSADRWIAFEKAWNDRLSKDGLSHFHASALNRCSGPFKNGWKGNSSRINGLKEDLADIAIEYSFARFACVIEIIKFKQIVTEELRQKWRFNVYSWAGFYLAFMVHEWRLFSSKFREMPLFVFDDGDIGKGMLIDKFNENGFGTPVFRFSKDTNTNKGFHPGFIPIQAADLLANTIFTAVHKQTKPDYVATEVMFRFQRQMGDFRTYTDENLEMIAQDFESNERLKESVKRLKKIKNEN